MGLQKFRPEYQPFCSNATAGLPTTGGPSASWRPGKVRPACNSLGEKLISMKKSFCPRAGAPTPQPRAPSLDDPGPAAEPPMDDVSEQEASSEHLRITDVQIVDGAKNQPEPTMLGAAQGAVGGHWGAYKSFDEEEEVRRGERFLGGFRAQAGLRAAAATPDPACPAPPLQQEAPSSHGEQQPSSGGVLGFGLNRSDERKVLQGWLKKYVLFSLKKQAWCWLRPGDAPGEQTSEAVTCALHSGSPSKSYISEAASEGRRPCGGLEADEPEELWLRVSCNTKSRQHTQELVIAKEFNDAAVYIRPPLGGRRLPSAEVAGGGSGGLDFPLAAIEGVFLVEQLLEPDHVTPMAAAAAAARRDLENLSGLSGNCGQILVLRVRKPCSKGRSSTDMAAPPSDGDGEGSFSVFLLGPPPAEEAAKICEPSGPTRLRGAGEVSLPTRSGNWDPGRDNQHCFCVNMVNPFERLMRLVARKKAEAALEKAMERASEHNEAVSSGGTTRKGPCWYHGSLFPPPPPRWHHSTGAKEVGLRSIAERLEKAIEEAEKAHGAAPDVVRAGTESGRTRKISKAKALLKDLQQKQLTASHAWAKIRLRCRIGGETGPTQPAIPELSDQPSHAGEGHFVWTGQWPNQEEASTPQGSGQGHHHLEEEERQKAGGGGSADGARQDLGILVAAPDLGIYHEKQIGDVRRLDSALRLLSGRGQLYFALGILQGIAKAKKASCREAAGARAAGDLRQRRPHQRTPLPSCA